MLSDRMEKAINKQINAEIYSAYLYLSMSAYAENAGLRGVAHWLFVQMQEEMTHAQRFYLYLIRVGARARLAAIEQPPAEFKTTLNVFEEVLKHERKVTASINALADLAIQDKDHATGVLLNWFVDEQVEEESNATEIIAKLKLAGGKGEGLFMIDKDLAARVFVPPPDLAAAGAPGA